MQEITLTQVCNEIEQAFKSQDFKRVDTLLWPALDQFPEFGQLWFYAGNYLWHTNKCALAVQAFERCLQLDQNPLVLANLGAAYRRLNAHEEGIAVLKKALDRSPDYAPALVNLGSVYVNEGTPKKGIPYLERAVQLGTESGSMERGALWNLALLYLEDARFAEGFDLYRTGLGDERQARHYGKASQGIKEPALLEPETPEAKQKTLIVWGEQGIGDELMFATCLEEARAEFKEVIFECHPRLEALHRDAHPGMRIFPTRKEDQISWPVTENIQADYKCPIGDLASRYRRTTDSFFKETKPTYTAPEHEARAFRRRLELVAQGRKIVGLATRGGVMQTARTYRTLRVPDAEYLFKNTDCLFVSLDYDDMTGFAQWCDEKFPGRYIWYPSIVQHWDYHHTAALVAATDLVVTVCQSVAHLSAGMGHPTRVLTPFRCAWRYTATRDDAWYWYPFKNVKLVREAQPDSWVGPLTKIIEELK